MYINLVCCCQHRAMTPQRYDPAQRQEISTRASVATKWGPLYAALLLAGMFRQHTDLASRAIRSDGVETLLELVCSTPPGVFPHTQRPARVCVYACAIARCHRLAPFDQWNVSRSLLLSQSSSLHQVCS